MNTAKEHIQIGRWVWWVDPDDNLNSGPFKIDAIEGDDIQLSNACMSEVGCVAGELIELPTHEEIGTLLIAVGFSMARHGLCAHAAMDETGQPDLVRAMQAHGIDGERADDLTRMDLAQAIAFVNTGEFE